MCSEEKIQKLENSKMFKNPKKIEYIMLILFLIPGNTKRFTCYVAGSTSYKTSKVFNNINICKDTINCVFNSCRVKYSRRQLENWCSVICFNIYSSWSYYFYSKKKMINKTNKRNNR